MPEIFRFYCHDCKTTRDCVHIRKRFRCLTCDAIILCDECGRPWTDGHLDP